MSETPYERVQRQTAERLSRAITPQITNLLADVQKQLRPLDHINEVLAPQYQAMLRRVADSFPRIEVPTVRLPMLEIPTLKLDYQSLFPDLAAAQAEVVRAIQPQIQLILDLQRDQFAEILANAHRVFGNTLPPNWQDHSVPFPNDLERLLLDEGLALAWVPPAPVLIKLFAAASPAERRRIIGRSWKSLTNACLTELGRVSASSLAEHVHFAKDAAQSLLDGSSSSSQALSASLLDSILRAEFDDKSRNTMTGQRSRPNIEDYPIRVAIVIGAIWGAHGQYGPSRGDKVPRRFSRHASAHAVSRRQYSRINAVLALMHVVALLRLLETEFR